MADIIFRARHTDVQDRFRKHAAAKLSKIEKLDGKTIRIDVQITAERNPRQSDRRERVELTVTSRGPAVRAEAAAEDRFAAFEVALGKLESRLRRACDRRKGRHGAHAAVRLADLPVADLSEPGVPATDQASDGESSGQEARDVPVEMQGEGPLVVREKFHVAAPMGIDQALFEMEMVGHDFFLFTDTSCGMPSVVYRRQGYQYGVIRLIEETALGSAAEQGSGDDQALGAGMHQAADGRSIRRKAHQERVAGS